VSRLMPRRWPIRLMGVSALAIAASAVSTQDTSGQRGSAGQGQDGNAGLTQAAFGYVIPPQRDMTRVAALVNNLRGQGIEVGVLDSAFIAGQDTLAAGTYFILLDQPQAALARQLLDESDVADPAPRAGDDAGWPLGLAFHVDVNAILDDAILDAAVTP